MGHVLHGISVLNDLIDHVLKGVSLLDGPGDVLQLHVLPDNILHVILSYFKLFVREDSRVRIIKYRILNHVIYLPHNERIHIIATS